MKSQRKITIGDKKYILTVNRSIIKTLNRISPDLLSINDAEDNDEKALLKKLVSIDVVAGLDTIFYDMIKVAQPTITKEKSDEILETFENEYDDVSTELISFALSVFQQGDQPKKQIVWE